MLAIRSSGLTLYEIPNGMTISMRRDSVSRDSPAVSADVLDGVDLGRGPRDLLAECRIGAKPDLRGCVFGRLGPNDRELHSDFNRA
jgi:hypothetical protein